MKLNPFKNKDEKNTKKAEDAGVVGVESDENTESGMAGSDAFSGTGGASAHKILKGFYVSEKSSAGMASNQYMFKVFNNANKSEIKKEVSKLFNVKVKGVRVLNMPEKRRDFGRHPGSRSGFKKAVVILEEGHSIGQAKP